MSDLVEVPEGFERVAEPDPEWRIAPPGTEDRCRARAGFRSKACGARAVARLRRPTSTRHGQTYRWWSYCGEHMYGRWIANGQVMRWVVREILRGAS